MVRTILNTPEISLDQDNILIFCDPHIPDSSEKITLYYLKNHFSHLFYPQDWYDNEEFMHQSFEPRLYTIPKNIQNSSRGEYPYGVKLYPAILVTYIFIMFYQKYNVILWPNDYIWCDTFDSNGDRIYVGRYYDPLNISKNGFSIHRHLTIKNNYGWL